MTHIIDPKEKQKLEDLIELLGSIRGRHTELVTVLIPAGANINLIQRQIEGEKSTASNIKSAATRKNVISALDMIIREMKNIKQTPENGLAFYCGNISDKEGVSDIQIWIYEPPRPLNVKIYRCDQEFIIEPLKEMIAIEEVYGLMVIDRQQATIGLLEGSQIKVLQKLTSGVPGKVRAGGQSSQRFHRITEGLAKEFFRRVAEELKNLFFDMPKLKGILIGGPIPTKEDFLDEGQLVTKLKEKIIAIKDLGYVDEHGLELLVESSDEEMQEQELIKEKKVLEKFFNTLGKERKKAAYREPEVRLALERGAVEILLISKKFNRDKQKEFEQMAENIGASVVLIGADHTDGEQFWNLTEGVGAILRFSLD
ncbi:MAG: peptide chain release factor aRF-1 [Nanoarchaeota archaeon]|nr:peptide chain release factor aRF-1 [Nanoarchaeota archaeon]MBU0977413.1 peptide chain release factor aRF-1 [Nanoarchaeota archaeon]